MAMNRQEKLDLLEGLTQKAAEKTQKSGLGRSTSLTVSTLKRRPQTAVAAKGGSPGLKGMQSSLSPKKTKKKNAEVKRDLLSLVEKKDKLNSQHVVAYLKLLDDTA